MGVTRLPDPVVASFRKPCQRTFRSKIMSDELQTINLKSVLAICDGDREFFGEIVQLFLEDSADRMEKLTQAVNEQDPQAIMQMGHALKGLSGNICAEAMQEAAVQIERSGRNSELGSTRNQLETLDNEYQKVQAELKKLTLGNQ